ncbi:MAG: DUF6438 domain-containing protein [Aggregatilineales bacterium]
MRKLQFFSLAVAIMLFGMAMPISAQDTSGDVALTISRTPCFGSCPIYTVTVYEDGTVVYEGTDFVDVTGTQTIQIEPETVDLLVNSFVEAGYFEWDDSYTTMAVTDMPSVITSVTFEGETKQINHYRGTDNAPLALSYLEIWLDNMLVTSQWTGSSPQFPASTFDETQTPIITLQRAACFGFCPVYDLVLYSDGSVVYVGYRNVEVVGVQIDQIDTSSVESLADQMALYGYFDWQDAYTERFITDQATVITSLNWRDQFKRIERYDGDPNAPIGLVRLEDQIDFAVNVSQWVGNNG